MKKTLLSEEAQAARRKYQREYMRSWRAANKNRIAELNRRYWEKKAGRDENAEQKRDK